MMLRLQRERMQGGYIPSAKEYFRFFGLDEAKLKYAKPDALVMHPGPINRGVEIDSNVADGRKEPHPRAGRNGGCGADRRLGSLGAAFAEWMRAQFRVKQFHLFPPSMAPSPAAGADQCEIDRSGRIDRNSRRHPDRRWRDPRCGRRDRAGKSPCPCANHRLRRRLRGAGPHRHAGLHWRAGRRAPRDDRDRDPGGGGRRRHDNPCPPRYQSAGRRAGSRRFSLAPRARYRPRAGASVSGLDGGSQGRGNRRDRLAATGGRRRLQRWRAVDSQCPGLAPGDAICARFRRSRDPSSPRTPILPPKA